MGYWGNDKLTVTSVEQVIYVNTVRDNPTKIHEKRPYYGLVYKLKGHVIYHFGKNSMDFSPGSVCLLPKNTDYTVELLEPGECIAVNFMLLGEPKIPPFSEHFRGTLKLEMLFKRIYSQWTTSLGVPNYGIMATLYEMIAEIDQTSRYSHITPTAEAKFNRLVSIFNQRYSEPKLSANEIAAASGFSLTSMRDAFSKIYGMSPIRYLTMLRLNAAKKLLAETEQSIDEIAHSCGFTDQFYFSRVFKRQCGVSPSEYRRSIY